MFNDKYGLTKAVLEGRKTQTRRIVNFAAVDDVYAKKDLFPICNNRIEPCLIEKYSKYKVGEIVAVAQSYKDCGYRYSDTALDRSPKDYRIVRGTLGQSKGWNNKMFVRVDACKHHIRITKVKIERLQDISDEDCLKEGVIKWYAGQKDIPFFCYPNSAKSDYDTPQEAFAHLINKVSRKDVWEENPYVFVYDFEHVK